MEEAALGFGSDMTWSMTMGEAEVRWRTRHLMGKRSTNLEASSIGRLPCGFWNQEVFYNVSNVGKGNSESGTKIFKEWEQMGNSLAVQWLDSTLSLPRALVQSLVEELRSPKPVQYGKRKIERNEGRMVRGGLLLITAARRSRLSLSLMTAFKSWECREKGSLTRRRPAVEVDLGLSTMKMREKTAGDAVTAGFS